MMYIVLTAMLAINVAAEVLEAFKVVDNSLIKTLEAVDMQNEQIYAAFNQAYHENKNKVAEWKYKADDVQQKSKEITTYVAKLKDELVQYSGTKPVDADNPMEDEGFYHITVDGDTLEINKEDDLNGPSELMITQKKAAQLKEKIEQYRSFLVAQVDDEELKKTILNELYTADPVRRSKDGKGFKTWESEHFESKPLIAAMTLLSKIQIDIKNAESNVAKHLFSEIDAGSFKFNRLGARVIANSNLVLQGSEYSAEIFLAAEDTTQQPEIFINNRQVEVKEGKAIYRGSTATAGRFKWSGLIKYKMPGGGTKSYPFNAEYQVSKPSVTMSATKMNVFYKGLKNPFDVGAGAIPNEDLEVTMTNGRVTKVGSQYIIEPSQLDPNQTKTKVSVYATIGGQRKLINTTSWRVKRVPDPLAKVAGKSGGSIKKEELAIQDGVLAVLEDFDFDFRYTITQFTLETTGQGGYTTRFPSRSNRFTTEQKNALKRINVNSNIYIGDIKARGDDGSIRELAPIVFKVK